MYTRNYYTESAGELSIPDNYDGTALREGKTEESSEQTTEKTSAPYIEDTYSEPTPKDETAPVFHSDKPRDDGGILGWFKKLPSKFSHGDSPDIFKNFFLRNL